MNWTLHFLSAAGSLAPIREQILADGAAAHAGFAKVLSPPDLDILVTRSTRVIPETGQGGRALGPFLCEIRLDPDNPNLAASLAQGALRRSIVHEAHHCRRMAGGAWGGTLGNALVNEGLAGQFVGHVFGTPPAPWERAVAIPDLAAALPDASALWTAPYGHDAHAAWFFGRGDRPRWFGYSLGYALAGAWCRASDPAGRAWFDIPARDVIATATDTPAPPQTAPQTAHQSAPQSDTRR